MDSTTPTPEADPLAQLAEMMAQNASRPLAPEDTAELRHLADLIVTRDVPAITATLEHRPRRRSSGPALQVKGYAPRGGPRGENPRSLRLPGSKRDRQGASAMRVRFFDPEDGPPALSTIDTLQALG